MVPSKAINHASRGKLRSKQRGNFHPSRAPVLSQPPPLSLQSNVANLCMRSSFEIDYQVNSINYRLDFNDMTFMMPTLKSCFAEYKLHRVEVWYVSALSIADVGLHAMVVSDDQLNYISVPDFTNIASAPGSHVMRCHETLCGSWFPTAPKNYSWIKTIDTSTAAITFLRIYLARQIDASSVNLSLHGAFVLDVHISLRGARSPDNILSVDPQHVIPNLCLPIE